MAYTDDAVKAKLSALNETQDSIVTVAQWVMFHRRHAERTAQLWFTRLRDSGAPKRLNLIYLVNEVVQQSKARRKDDFLIAFSPIIADAMAVAYKGAANDVQQKLRRVVEVWRQRQIFEMPIQEAVEARIDDLDKARSSGKKPFGGGSLFSGGSGIPTELQPLASLQTAISKATVTAAAASSNANTEYDKLVDPATPVPTPPVHAARLSALLKSLANAEGAVAESIKARQALISGLEKMLDTNRAALAKEKTQVAELTGRKDSIETKKREVEDGIMRGLSAEESSYGNGSGPSAHNDDADRPDVEALTPPVESLTPVGSPKHESVNAPIPNRHAPSMSPPPPNPQIPSILSSLTVPSIPVQTFPGQPQFQAPANGTNNARVATAKKRKMADDFEDGAFTGDDAMADLDEDVAELLRQESRKAGAG